MSLDQWTLSALKRLAEQLNISKAEVMRRAVRTFHDLTEKEASRPSPLEALDFLQNGGGLSAGEALVLREQVAAERNAKKYWWE